MSTKVLAWGLLIAVIFLAPAPAPAQSMQEQPIPLSQAGGRHNNNNNNNNTLPSLTEENPSLSAKQKLSLMHANFEKSKSDAVELAALAKGLREELDKPNGDVPSLEVINRLEKIEKLAKKIRDETKGY